MESHAKHKYSHPGQENHSWVIRTWGVGLPFISFDKIFKYIPLGAPNYQLSHLSKVASRWHDRVITSRGQLSVRNKICGNPASPGPAQCDIVF